MSNSFEEMRRKELDIQEKQLFAQRVTAAAAVASAAATAGQTAIAEKMRAQMEANSKREAEHEREITENQNALLRQQQAMGEEQEEHNFNMRILSTLSLLKEEEKAQYVTEQLLPKVKETLVYWNVNTRQRSEILKCSGLFEFASNYTTSNPGANEFFAVAKKTNEGILRSKAIQSEYETKKAELENFALQLSKRKTPAKAALSVGVLAFFGLLIVLPLCLILLKPLYVNSSGDPIEPFTIMLLLIFLALLFAIPLLLSFKHYNTQAEKRTNDQLQVERIKHDLAANQPKIEPLVHVDDALKCQEASWNNVSSTFVDDYLASAAGKAFVSEEGKQNMQLTVTLPWRDIIDKQQSFLPPSARPTFDKHWMPLLIKEDKGLKRAVLFLKVFQSDLRAKLIKFVQPDFEKQTVAIKPTKEFVESDNDESEELIEQCLEVICNERKASVSLLQRRLRLGYGRAARIMDELEKRGVVGGSKGAEPREILIDIDGRSDGLTVKNEGGDTVRNC